MTAGWRGPGALGVLLAAFALGAEAQYPSGRRGQDSRLPGQRPSQEQPAPPRPAHEPLYAFERELPSLKADLRLDPAQVTAFDAFARAVRDVAEIARSRTRKLMAPRTLDAPAPPAPQVFAAFADDDRLRSEAMADATARLRELYEVLGPQQRSLLDRRVMLAQADPLGQQ